MPKKPSVRRVTVTVFVTVLVTTKSVDGTVWTAIKTKRQSKRYVLFVILDQSTGSLVL